MKKYLTIMGILFTVSIVLWVIAFFQQTKTVEINTNRNNEGLIVTENRVFDQADLLSEEEESKLQKRIEAVREDNSCDIVVLTTADAEGKSSMAYADDFYDTHDFGYEDAHGTGVLFLIDMDNREIWFSTSGGCIDAYTTDRIDSAIDLVYSNLKAGKYYLVFDGCIDSVGRYMSSGMGSESFAEAVLGAFVLAGVVTLVLLLVLVISRGGKVTVNSSTYLVAASKEVYDRSDIHYDTVVTTRIIETDSGGSSSGGGGSHTSSGGFSHGGGGRSF